MSERQMEGVSAVSILPWKSHSITFCNSCNYLFGASPYSRGEGLPSPPPSLDRDHPRTPRHVLKAAQHCSDHVSLRALAGAQVGLRQGLTTSPNLSFHLPPLTSQTVLGSGLVW